MDQAERQRRAEAFITQLPHARALSLALTDIGPGEVEMRLPHDDRLVGDPETGALHGGAVSTLMDTCSGAAVMSHPDAGPMTATLDLRIEYMRPARPGCDITARAVCHHVTRSVAFVRVTAGDGTSDVPVATATGAFTVTAG